MLNALRQLRNRSAFVAGLHACLRGPYYWTLAKIWPDGLPIELPSGDRFRIHTRFLGMDLPNYERPLVRAFCSFLRDGMTVIDAGAHVGIYSMIASARVGDAGRVVAIEASPTTVRLLQRHLDINACPNVDVIHAAVGEKEGEISFAYRPDPTDPVAFANSIAHQVEGEKAMVRMTTLDEVCKGLSPGLIKMDIEGAELLALRGAEVLLRTHRPTVIVAVHPDQLRMLGGTPRQVIEYMRGLGFNGTKLDGTQAEDPGFEEVVFRPMDGIGTP